MSKVTTRIVVVAALLGMLGVVSGCERSSDVRLGTPGDDTLEGTSRPNLLPGLGGNDEIFGHGEWDVISGGSGSDLLYGGPGVDIVRGGEGDDQLVVWDDSDRDIVTCGPGNDTVYMSSPEKALGSIDKQTCEVIQNAPSEEEAPASW